MPGKGLTGQGVTGNSTTGGSPWPIETGRAVLGASFTGGRRQTPTSTVVANATRATVTVSALGATATVPAAPQGPPDLGLVGRGLTGRSLVGGSPAQLTTGHALVGLSLTGGWQGQTPAAIVTANAQLATVTVSSLGATAITGAGDTGYFWGIWFTDGGGSENPTPYKVPTPLADIGIAGGLGRITSLDAENGFDYFVIGGVVYGVGDNSSNEIDGTATTLYVVPQNVSAAQGLPAGIIQVDGGNELGVAVDPSGFVWAWGNASLRTMGNGTTSGTQTPAQKVLGVGGTGFLQVPTTPDTIGGVPGIISGGAGRAMAIVAGTGGQVAAWGEDQYGQCGDNQSNPSGTLYNPTPVWVLNPAGTAPFTGAVFVTVGDHNSYILDNLGQVWAFGQGNWGQMGLGPSDPLNLANPLPVLVDLAGAGAVMPIVAVSGGGEGSPNGHAMALDSAGNVWLWGSNSQGQIGNNHTGAGTAVSTPYKVTNGSFGGIITQPCIAVSAGGINSFALGFDGTLYGWGANTNGECGIGSLVSPQKLPVKVSVPTGQAVNLLFAGANGAVMTTQGSMTAGPGLAAVAVTAKGATATSSGGVTATGRLATVTVSAEGASTGTTTSATTGLAVVTVRAFNANASIPAGAGGPFVGRIV